jgi:hypothetical protein
MHDYLRKRAECHIVTELLKSAYFSCVSLLQNLLPTATTVLVYIYLWLLHFIHFITVRCRKHYAATYKALRQQKMMVHIYTANLLFDCCL